MMSALDVTKKAGGYVWGKIAASFRALFASFAVWTAVAVVGLTAWVGGYWLGYLKGAHAQRNLRAEVSTLMSGAAHDKAALESAQGRASDYFADLSRSKARVAALEAEVAKLRRAKSNRPAVSSRPVPRRTEKSASAPFWPFRN